ncbi:MAG: DUF3575 domain-containing protein [Bacteroidales bacterium]|nr:DUF3575 domain-containing protein [Bacteroidales bacterium]
MTLLYRIISVASTIRFRVAILLAFGLTAAQLRGDEMTFNTNLLYWLTATPNLEADFSVSNHVSISASGGYNAFNFPNYIAENGADANPKLHHWAVRGEGRYWFDRTFRGVYLGIHAFGGQFNAGGLRFPAFLRDYRYEGHGAGAGVSVGYRLSLGRRWGIEASLGAGYINLHYTKYDCGSCGHRLRTRSRNLFGPTKAAISVSYLFSTQARKPAPAAELLPATEIIVAELSDTSAIVTEPVIPESAEVESVERAVATDTARFIFRYPVDTSDYMADFASNGTEMRRVHALMDSVQSVGGCIKAINVIGYASPEYDAAHNRSLSENRARSAAGALVDGCAISAPISVSGAGDDWSGLCRALESSAIPCAEAAIALIRTRTSDTETKARLRRLDDGRYYRRMLGELYPSLRRTEIEIIYTVSSFK